MSETKILVVNDLHAGSNVAVMPDKVKTGRNKVYSNDVQQFLYDEWKDMCREVDADICIVNGDTCDGINGKEDGYGLWTTDKSVQVNTATKLLKMINADEYYCTQGSLYHTGDPSMDRLVAEKLNARAFDEDLLITVDSVRMHVRHKTPYTKIPTSRSTGVMHDMVTSIHQMDAYGDIDLFLRAHTHYAHAVWHEGKVGIINPCWKGRDGFMRRDNMGAADIGYTVITVKDGRFAYDIETFKIPAELTTIDSR